MSKEFLTLHRQCEKLINEKLVSVEDRDMAKKILLNDNYFNIASCSKIKYATGTDEEGNHTYNPTLFLDWKNYFDMDCAVSEYLIINTLRFERRLNSRTAYYASELVRHRRMNTDEFNRFKRIIQGDVDPDIRRYDGTETWVWITKKTFGGLKRVIEWLWKNNFRDVVRKIIKNIDFLQRNVLKKLDEIVNLRNNIFHFRPLSIYLVHGNLEPNFSSYPLRKDVIEYIHTFNKNNDFTASINEITRNARNFITIKNNKKTAEIFG